MRISAVTGLLAGVFPILIGFCFAPSPTYDPGGWGPCSLESIFPIHAEDPAPASPYGFDNYECVYAPGRVAIFLVVAGGLLVVSGLFTAWVSRIRSLAYSAIPTVLTIPALLVFLAYDREWDPIPTIAAGVAVTLCATGLAIVGGWMSRWDA